MTLSPSRRPRRVAAAAGLVAVLLVAGCGPDGASGPTPAAPSSGTGTSAAVAPTPFDVPLVPDSGVYLGTYYGDGTQEDTDEAIGRVPQIHLTYVGWEDAWTTDEVLAEDVERGQVSLVNWEPFGADFHDIVDGRYDDMLAQRASEAADLAEPVFVDLAAEMNEEEGWGGHDPALYVAAYRHVHDAFEGKDGSNVVWVWAPNNVDSAGAPPALDYYPGDDYVDWTGIDGYNWGTSDPDFEWQSFEGVFRDMYDDLHTLGKPIIVGETASAEEGGSKADWIEGIAGTLRDDFPDIRALVWFDVDKERDWRLRSSEESLAAFRALEADELFQTP
jgi:hypothetical protein